jgi:alkylation response protein AidB-like acyl-CoA dehydrogenase
VDVERFRRDAQSWLATNAADAPRDYGAILPPELVGRGVAWQRRLVDAGLAGIHWPLEWGGRGLTPEHNAVWIEECARAGVPPFVNMVGIVLAGGAILRFGTPEQQARHLRQTLQADQVWCQLFSEPGAGSDLASLQTRAIRDGDDYIINGQKIWTSGAHHADMGILIARTDPDAPKHRGISYFLLDMKTPGITVRPLVNMLNSHEFNEVYFEDVRVPRSQLLGDENRGWYLATTTLDFERSGIATSVAHQLIARDLVRFAKENPIGRASVEQNTGLRNELADRAIEAQVESLICYRIITMQERGEIPNKESSIAKLYSSELDVRLAVTGMHLGGMHAQTTDRADVAALGGKLARFYMHSTTSPIGGGTSEIQRNIIAGRGLGLPRG